jgi:hypothetical protein
MELVVLFIICALLFFGPRKGGGMPSPLAMALAALFLLWFLVAIGFGSLWNHFFRTMPQP